MNVEFQVLTLFNERVDRLSRSALTTRMKNPNYKLDYNRMMNREWISAEGISEDNVDAFIFNVRLLIQDNDGFSIRCLAENVYSSESVPTEFSSRFDKQRQIWHDHLQCNSIIKHYSEDRNFTHKELFDTLMYGGLAHVNRDKVAIFSFLTAQGALSSFVFVSFLSSLRIFLDIVKEIQKINIELLRHFKSNQQ